MNTGRLIFVFLIVALTAAGARGEESLADRFFISPDRWETVYEKRGITVYAQKVPMSDVLVFRAASVLEAPVEQVMEVLRRVDITDEWMPDIEIKYAVEDRSDFEAVTYSINEMPWPFAPRELLLYNRLRLDRKRKLFAIEVHSIEDDRYPVARGNVRAHMYCGETRVQPAGKGKTRVDLILFVDPKGFIPKWLVNLFQKRLPYNFLQALELKAAATSFPLRPAYRKMLDELEAMQEASR